MSGRAPLVILPRELGAVPPAPELVGVKARGMAQLLALKARVPRFGILTAEAFDAHMAQAEIAEVIAAATRSGLPDEAARLGHGDAIVRAVMRHPLPVTVRIGLQELLSAFAEEDVLVVRASVVGDALESAAVAGALDAALGVKGKEQLEEAVLRLMALAYHPRTLGQRDAAGLAPLGMRVAVVVQRMVQSESSGTCVSLELKRGGEELSSMGSTRVPRALVRGCWGLAGGIGGKEGNPRIPADLLRVERPAVAADGVAEDARVETELGAKSEAMRLDEPAPRPDGTLARAARMHPLTELQKKEPCVSPVQARMIAREALRLEAAFGKPQVMSWAFAGRLLYVLDAEPLFVPIERVESTRARTWDDRLLPSGLLVNPTPLTFSVWQKAGARGMERAGRILGVKGVLLEEVRPQLPRMVGLVGGRFYANVEVVTALLDLLPFADKARAALADATGQAELVPRKAPPPGFWQRQRQKLDEGRWPAQLERMSELALTESARFRGEIEGVLRTVEVSARRDPDALMDTFDTLEDTLSKCVAALALSGLAAALFQVELAAVAAETELKDSPWLVVDLLGGEAPDELVAGVHRFYALAAMVRASPPLRALLDEHKGRMEALVERLGADAATLDEDSRRFAEALGAMLQAPAASCTGDLALETPRPDERPAAALEAIARLLDSAAGPELLDNLARNASGACKKAEYTLEQMAKAGSLKGAARKRLEVAVAGVRKHGRDAAVLWIPTEQVVARLRACALALGARLFEHGLLDLPGDVWFLEGREFSGLVRGTGVDVDGRPLVAARRRQASTRPAGLPRRVETRGVVATSLVNEDELEPPPLTAPGSFSELSGRSVAAGVVNDDSVLLDGNPLVPARPAVPSGVVLVRTATLRDLPLLLAAKAVVAERGTVWGPATWALRALRVPCVVDAPAATAAFQEGTRLVVDGGRGTVRPAPDVDEPSLRPMPGRLEPNVFAREAVLSDPRMQVRATRPADPDVGLVPPPLVRPPAAGDDGFDQPMPKPAARSLAWEQQAIEPTDYLVVPHEPIKPTTPELGGLSETDEETHIDEDDILEKTDIEKR